MIDSPPRPTRPGRGGVLPRSGGLEYPVSIEDMIAARGAAAVTVADLVTVLQQMPQDAKVWADGCDCCNPVVGATVDGGRVTLDVKA